MVVRNNGYEAVENLRPLGCQLESCLALTSGQYANNSMSDTLRSNIPKTHSTVSHANLIKDTISLEYIDFCKINFLKLHLNCNLEILNLVK